jgi:hypothetical protein
MWKLFACITLTVCTFAVTVESPSETPSEPSDKPSVSAECCGRVRHGIVAIGGETTGTTITFNRIAWELQLHDDDARNFAKKNHGEVIVVTGQLRTVAGTEAKPRWIIDVDSMSKVDPKKHDEGAKLTMRGTLRASDRSRNDGNGMSVVVDDKTWPIDTSADARLHANAMALVGEPVVAKCHVARADEEDSASPIIVRVNTVEHADSE